jgi:RNAse (barnase) inhibitor barstar
MKTVYIDFTDIGDYEDFYAQLKEKFSFLNTSEITLMRF